MSKFKVKFKAVCEDGSFIFTGKMKIKAKTDAEAIEKFKAFLDDDKGYVVDICEFVRCLDNGIKQSIPIPIDTPYYEDDYGVVHKSENYKEPESSDVKPFRSIHPIAGLSDNLDNMITKDRKGTHLKPWAKDLLDRHESILRDGNVDKCTLPFEDTEFNSLAQKEKEALKFLEFERIKTELYHDNDMLDRWLAEDPFNIMVWMRDGAGFDADRVDGVVADGADVHCALCHGRGWYIGGDGCDIRHCDCR